MIRFPKLVLMKVPAMNRSILTPVSISFLTKIMKGMIRKKQLPSRNRRMDQNRRSI